MIEIKCSVKIRGGEGEQREPHVWKRRAGQTKTNPIDNFSMKASRSLFFIINIFFQQDRETMLLFFKDSLELSHPAVPVASVLIKQPPATKYVLKRPMNIWSALWSNTRRRREAFTGWWKGGKTSVDHYITLNYIRCDRRRIQSFNSKAQRLKHSHDEYDIVTEVWTKFKSRQCIQMMHKSKLPIMQPMLVYL